MNATGWWQSALQEWSDTTGFRVDFLNYVKPQSKRELGEWWLDKGRWNLHLESLYYARLEPEPELTVRRTLTWMLSLLRQTQRPTTEMLLTSWFENLLAVPEDTLDKLLVGEGLLDAPESGWIAKYGTGWLALVTPQYPKTVTLEERAELRQNMRHVLTSYLPDGFIGWLNLNLASEQGLVFIGDEVLAESDPKVAYQHAEVDAFATPERSGEAQTAQQDWGNVTGQVRPAYQYAGALRQLAENLLDAISQDVLIRCEIEVGQRLQASTDLANALLTVALLRRKRNVTEQRGSIAIWGEQPINIFLQTIPSRGVEWFLQSVTESGLFAASLEEPAGILLPEELSSSLHGLVAANLNVSEAARLLFVHRNTLLHRVERIRELTGYDIRNFRDALVLWLTQALGRQRTNTRQSN